MQVNLFGKLFYYLLKYLVASIQITLRNSGKRLFNHDYDFPDFSFDWSLYLSYDFDRKYKIPNNYFHNSVDILN